MTEHERPTEELVRYEDWFDCFNNGGMRKDPHGEYVLYDQAAAIIAAKDEVQKTWQDIAKHHTGYENPSMAFRILLERAEVAEAKNRELNIRLETAVHNARKYADDCVYLEAKLAKMEGQT